MSYVSFISAIIGAVASRIQTVSDLKTVAVTEPQRLDLQRLPAAFVVLDRDDVTRRTRFLETHELTIMVSVIRVVKGTQHGDTELAQGMQDGLTLVGACYDTLVGDRTLGGVARELDVVDVDFGRTALDVGVVFWGEIQLKVQAHYAPGQPVDGVKIGKVEIEGNIE